MAIGVRAYFKGFEQRRRSQGLLRGWNGIVRLHEGRLQAAELWSRMCDLEYNPMHRLVLLSILGAEGKTAEAAQEKDWLGINAPEMMKNIRREVSLASTAWRTKSVFSADFKPWASPSSLRAETR
jgi:hypothetical protein